MTRSPTDNLISLDAAIKRRSARPMAERDRSREWVTRLRNDIKAGHLDAAAATRKVKLATVLRVAKSLASPRYPSFWGAGVYAKQTTIGADPDVGLSGDHVARVIKLLAKTGYLELADPRERKGRTCLLRPKLPGAAADTPPPTSCRTTPTSCRTPPTSCRSTSDIMSDESTNLIPNQKADPTLAEPSGNAANRQAKKGKNDSASSLGEPAETEAKPLDREVLPPGVRFEVFWNGSAEPRGPLGFALAQWGKLTIDQQRCACERPARDAQAGVWLRDRGFDLQPDIGKPRERARPQRSTQSLEMLVPYSAEWHAERKLRIAAGLDVKFMDKRAAEGVGWTVKGSP